MQQRIHTGELMRRLKQSLKPQNHWKSVTHLTIVVFI